MSLTENQVKDIEELLDQYTCVELDLMVRQDIKEHFAKKLLEKPEADVTETVDFIVDYIFQKYSGTEVQALLSSQIIAKGPVLLMRADMIKYLKE